MSDLKEFFARHDAVIKVALTRVEGSSPREEGACMFVGNTQAYGTIGGGQLEYMALDEARKLLATGGAKAHMSVPLGPEIGQCCGGRVDITLTRAGEDVRADAIAGEAAARANWPEVLVFGAGHIGRALARSLAPLPVRARIIDSRASELSRVSDCVTCLTALPEAKLRAAGPGAAYVIVTHDHALDFLLAAEALARGDARYVGMIGSATKRAAFRGWLRRAMPDQDDAQLTCPMAPASSDKRPEVIAAFIAAEVMAMLAMSQNIHNRLEQIT